LVLGDVTQTVEGVLVLCASAQVVREPGARWRLSPMGAAWSDHACLRHVTLTMQGRNTVLIARCRGLPLAEQLPPSILFPNNDFDAAVLLPSCRIVAAVRFRIRRGELCSAESMRREAHARQPLPVDHPIVH
jgi:hypothetical protein